LQKEGGKFKNSCQRKTGKGKLKIEGNSRKNHLRLKIVRIAEKTIREGIERKVAERKRVLRKIENSSRIRVVIKKRTIGARNKKCNSFRKNLVR
jgi:hypothetical protein